jgi:hypothetical protein
VKAEKLLLESTLDSLKAKHLEELQLLEDSYRYCTFTATQIPYSGATESTCIIVTDSPYSITPRWVMVDFYERNPPSFWGSLLNNNNDSYYYYYYYYYHYHYYYYYTTNTTLLL